MTPKLIIGYDGSENAEDALALGADLTRTLDATAVVAAVVPDPYRERLPGGGDLEAAWRKRSDAVLARALSQLGDLQVETAAIDDEFPSEGLRAIATQAEAIMIVVGAPHRGRLGRLLVGSESEALLVKAPCPVAVAPPGYAGGARRLGHRSTAVASR